MFTICQILVIECPLSSQYNIVIPCRLCIYIFLLSKQILNRYKDSLETRSKHNNDKGEILPTSVILVGHSMGGFVARAAVVHPELRPGSVRTVVTLSSPHRYVASLEVYVVSFCSPSYVLD